MKKRIVIEWIMITILLLVVCPLVIVNISDDGEQLFSLFRLQIWIIIPVALLSLYFSQQWRKRKSSGMTSSEIWKSFIPFVKLKNKT